MMWVLMFLHSLPCISSATGYDYHKFGNHDCCCFGYSLTPPPHTSLSWVTKRAGASASGVILVITLLNIIVYKLSQLQETRKPSSFPSQHLCRQFLLAEIRLATNNFDEALMIGKGGFGKVYRGVIDHGAMRVAIKRLDSRSKQGASEFWTEIKMLSNFRHNHLVSLIGYCDEFNEMIVVYEYVSGGNLGERVYKTTKPRLSLSWVERLKICIGAARALDYLHTGTGIRHRVIHRDVKTSNILLDEHMAAKLSDLGMSKIGPVDQGCSHVSTDVKGSFGYFDPNYFMTRRLTRKSDVYSFGVVLLEVLCGRPALDPSLGEDELGLVGWAQRCIRDGMLKDIIDPYLMGLIPDCSRVKSQIMPDCLKAFVEVAEKCLRTRPKDRPTMAEVVVALEAALALQERSHSFVVYKEMEKCSPYRGGKNSYTKSGKIMTLSRMLRDIMPAKSLGALDPLKNKKGQHRSKSRDAFQEVNIAESGLRVFSLAGLKVATRNFSDDMALGEGAFGKVFKGWVDQESYIPSKMGSGMPIAVKKLNTESNQGLEEWKAEVKILGRLSHPNLVKLLGYCSEDNELLLVYEFMEKGILEDYILKKGFEQRLPWSLRMRILIGAARGLAYLHATENQIIYRDLKTSNILLDKDLNAKLSDFGFARGGPINGDAHLSTPVFGTYGYAAPEYVATGHLSGKNDIYAFGVVLLETLTGLRVIDKTRPEKEQNLVEWARPILPHKRKLKTIIDPTLGDDYPPEAAFWCGALVVKCTQPEPKERPSMEQVLQSLEQIDGIKSKLLKERA